MLFDFAYYCLSRVTALLLALEYRQMIKRQQGIVTITIPAYEAKRQWQSTHPRKDEWN